MLRSEHAEIFIKTNINNDDNSVVWEKKLYEVTKQVEMKIDDCSECCSMKKCEETKRTNIKKSKENDENNSDQITSTKRRKINSRRNYWVEYWDHNSNRWICTFFSET